MTDPSTPTAPTEALQAETGGPCTTRGCSGQGFLMGDLGDRMKEYESVTCNRLTRRVPVIIRLDGKAFHTLTRNMKRPYDPDFHNCMWNAAKLLCEEVQGCQIAYVQSDEISLLLTDWGDKTTAAWFDNQVQKMVSVAAALATCGFLQKYNTYWPEKSMSRIAFDARAFPLPATEICNYFLWRQQDATRNSLNMLAQVHFSHKALHGKNTSAMQDMLMLQHGVNWNDCPISQKRGVCVVKAPDGKWHADMATPIFSQDRVYIERYAVPPEWMDPYPLPPEAR